MEQQTVLFYQRILRGSSPIIRVLLQLKQGFASSLRHVFGSFLTRVENYGLARCEVYPVFCVGLYFTVFVLSCFILAYCFFLLSYMFCPSVYYVVCRGCLMA